MTLLAGELDRIWAGDLFDRRAEADMLQAYLESASNRALSREDQRAFTLAIDAGYGEGKTFFLRRFAQHLAASHPVAFVDAWADDIVDEPLTALAATLREALDPIIQKSPAIADRWQTVLEKTGRIASIASRGIFKRGLGLVFTSAAVEAAGEVFSGVGDKAEAAIQDDLKTSGADAVKALEGGGSVAPGALMQARIAAFQDGKEAIEALKVSLEVLIAALAGESLQAPVIIVIDELDRCRPTYAVKLLEEIKHLFDVPGLVFVFGMHGDQLAHSVSGAYGPGFDGRAYLRRFIAREYRLKRPAPTPLVRFLLERSGLDTKRLSTDRVRDGLSLKQIQPAEAISWYARQQRLSLRDVYRLIDILQTCLALTRASLLMSYLLPLIIGRLQGRPSGSFEVPASATERITYVVADMNGKTADVEAWAWADQLRSAARRTQHELVERVNRNDRASSVILDARSENDLSLDPFANPRNYPDLLEAVGRFTDTTTEPEH